MDSLTFSSFIKEAKDYSPLLTDETITEYLENTDKYRTGLILYMYRIAAFVAAQMRNSSEFRHLDDSDFVDAAQECVNVMDTIIEAKPAKFSGYCAVTFRRHMRRYLRCVDNGGMGNHLAEIERPTSLPEESYESESGDDALARITALDGPEPAIGLGDPLDELLRLERVSEALDSLNEPLPASASQGSAKRTAARDKRVEKLLGNGMNVAEFCAACGASIPHRLGEGRCPECMHHLS